MSDLSTIASQVNQLATMLDASVDEVLDCLMGILLSEEECGQIKVLLDDLRPISRTNP